MASTYASFQPFSGQPWRARRDAGDSLDYDLVDQLLLARGVEAADLARHRAPTLRQFLPDPSVFADMDVAARRLADQRDREGSLDGEDLAALGLVPTAAVGFTSNVWDVEVLAEVDGVALRLESRLVRRRGPGVAEVVVTARRFLGEGSVAAGDLLPIPVP